MDDMLRGIEKVYQDRYAALQRRGVGPQGTQAQMSLAAPEHEEFVRNVTAENPIAGVAVALGSLPYALGKEMYFNPQVRGAVDAVLPEQVSVPMWRFLEKQVGHSRSQNKDPWGQIAAAAKGFGQGLGAYFKE